MGSLTWEWAHYEGLFKWLELYDTNDPHTVWGEKERLVNTSALVDITQSPEWDTHTKQ